MASWKLGLGVLETRLGVLEAGLGVLEAGLGVLEARLGVLEARLGVLEAGLGVLERIKIEFKLRRGLKAKNSVAISNGNAGTDHRSMIDGLGSGLFCADVGLGLLPERFEFIDALPLQIAVQGRFDP